MFADCLWAFGRSLTTGERDEDAIIGGTLVARFFMQFDALVRALSKK